MKWAADQTTGDPGCKALLFALANYAGENGACFPTQDRLSGDTEQSVDTVQRKLRRLEAMGYVYRTKRDRRRHGHFGGDEIVMLFDDAARAYALRLGWDPQAENGTCDISTAPQIAAPSQPQFAAPSIPHSCAVPTGPHCCGTNNQIDSLPPKSPPEDFGKSDSENAESENQNSQPEARAENPVVKKTSTPAGRSDESGEDWRDLWLKLEKLWPWPDTAPREPSRRAFQRLSPAERLLAIEHGPAYVAARRRQGKRVSDPRRYLADKAWEPFAAGPVRSTAPRVWVRKGSTAWDAWQAVWRRERGAQPMFASWITLPDNTRSEGCYRPTLFPPRSQPPPDAVTGANSMHTVTDF